MSKPTILTFNMNSISYNYAGPLVITGLNFTNESVVHFSEAPDPAIPIRGIPTMLTVSITTAISSFSGHYDVTVDNGLDGISPPKSIRVDDPPHAVPDPGPSHYAAAVAAAGAGPHFKIGIFSSIAYSDTAVQQWFQFGLGALGEGRDWKYVIADKLGYNRETLKEAARNLLTIPANQKPFDLVVTFGGNITANAFAEIAESYKVNFLSVVGNLKPEFAKNKYLCGGLSLDTVAANAERFRHLTHELKIPAAEIGFLSNNTSKMFIEERQQWSQLNPTGGFFTFNPLEFHANPAKPVDDIATIQKIQNGFSDVFQRFARTGLSTMVISADPFFQHYKNQLITAANSTQKRMCYPLQAYRNKNGVQPMPGRHLLHGPKLARECFFLGRDAAEIVFGGDRRPCRIASMWLDESDDES